MVHEIYIFLNFISADGISFFFLFVKGQESAWYRWIITQNMSYIELYKVIDLLGAWYFESLCSVVQLIWNDQCFSDRSYGVVKWMHSSVLATPISSLLLPPIWRCSVLMQSNTLLPFLLQILMMRSWTTQLANIQYCKSSHYTSIPNYPCVPL